MGHGGRRSGAGKKKGTKWPSTLAKAAAREEARKLITAEIPRMLRSHVEHACGIGHLYTRDATGKFSRVTNLAEVDRLLAEGTEGSHYWIFTKDPSGQSFSELMNRALDKPKEQALDVNVSMDWDKRVAWMRAARQRLQQHEKQSQGRK